MNTNNRKRFSVSLKFNYCSEHNTLPEIEVRLNHEALTVNNYSVHGMANFGDNIISIELLNKKPHYTKLAVEIDEFTIDKVDLTHYIKLNGVYVTDLGIQETTYGYLHRNGVLTFNFVCPTFYFLRNKNLVKDQELTSLSKK